MVVRQASLGPGEPLDPLFEQALQGLAAQDHPRLRSLFLLVGAPGVDHGELPDRIRALVPSSVVRTLDGNPGFGAAANEVVRSVKGNVLYCFLHDDLVLEPTTISTLAAALVESNAGIVGPKLVEASTPDLLQSVGLVVDRFGEVDTTIEPGEVDQGQRDGAGDVFAVPSACLMVRSDLFVEIGGFDPAIEYVGDDVDLCWRAHLAGARVVVVPSAVARHEGALWVRRPDLHLPSLAGRARVRSVVTLTGAGRLWWVLPQMVAVTLVEAVVGALTGRFREALVSVRSLVGLVPRTGAALARRRRVASLRRIPDSEVAAVQAQGSVRLSSFLRSRERRAQRGLDAEEGNERRWRRTAGGARLLALGSVVAVIVLGSRGLISGGVPGVGQFVPIPSSPWHLASTYLSGWNHAGVGGSSPTPSAVAVVALLSVVTLFHMSLLHVLLVVGSYLLGALGAWRLAAVFPTPRARITVLVVYAALPLPSALLSAGRLNALACYAALPWAIHLIRRIAGLDTRWVELDHDANDGVRPVPAEKRRWLVARLILVVALGAAFAPVFPLLFLAVAVVLALATLLAGGYHRPAADMALAAFGAAVAAFVLHLPWSWSLLGGDAHVAVSGVSRASGTGVGVRRLLEMQIGTVHLPSLGVGVLVPVLVAPLVARSWRFAWAVRAGSLATVFGVLVVLDDRQALPFHLAEPGVLLVPVAVGVALSAGCLAAAFDADVLAGTFGWRQPLGLLSVAALAVGLVPGALAPIDGRWGAPTHTLQSALVQTSESQSANDTRVLWIGEADAIPVAAAELAPGIAYAVSDLGGVPSRADLLFGVVPSQQPALTSAVREAVLALQRGATNRFGRLIAPFGIRYVVVPLADGMVGTLDHPLVAPLGLAEAFDRQLDLAAPLSRPQQYLVYENRAAPSAVAMLSLAGAAGSHKAGAAAVAQIDLTGSTSVGGDPLAGDTFSVTPGTLHLAVPYDDSWRLHVSGTDIAPRRAFGTSVAFDVTGSGTAVLRYTRPLSRWAWVLVQALLWMVVVAVAANLRVRRRRDGWVYDPSAWGDPTTPLIDLSVPEFRE
jgi:GT2 family glycosyltransferase